MTKKKKATNDCPPDLAQKIREAIDYHRTIAHNHRYRAEQILEAVERSDVEFLRRAGVFTEGEAAAYMAARAPEVTT